MSPSNPPSGISWNSHSIITRYSLADSVLFETTARVRPIEDFLAKAEQAVRMTLIWYRGLILKKRGATEAYGNMGEVRTWRDFLNAAWLNPDLEPHYVKPTPLLERHRSLPHDISRSGPPGPSYQATPMGDELSIGELLCAYSDEPDWGMDQELAGIGEYQYGELPLGRLKGPSSQAHFHMCFIADGPIGRRMARGVKISFMEERVRLFLALSGIAMVHGEDYWGWRFAAWAVHYLQDLTQPYHAKLFPPGILIVARRFLDDPNPRDFAKRNSNLLTNRHHLVEAVTHYLLNETLKSGEGGLWREALKKRAPSPGEFLRSIMVKNASFSASMASRLDRSAISMIRDSRIIDRAFHFEDHPDYPIGELVNEARERRAHMFAKFEEQVAGCLGFTGQSTRYVVQRALFYSSQSSS